MMGWDFSLSASKLNVLRECEACFWLLHKQNHARPDTPFPTLPNGIDRIMKVHMDQYRGALPPDIQGKVPGALWGTAEQIKKLRHWKSGLKAEVECAGGRVSLIGALDDLLVCEDGFSPLDVKTKGDLPKDNGAFYYQCALDVYGLLLQANGMHPNGRAFLWYVYPCGVELSANPMSTGLQARFLSKVYELTSSPDRAIDTIQRAVTVLTGPRPRSHSECGFCAYAKGYPREGVLSSVTIETAQGSLR